MVWLDGKGIGELPWDIWLKLGWLAYAIWPYIWDFKHIRPYIRSKNDGHSLKQCWTKKGHFNNTNKSYSLIKDKIQQLNNIFPLWNTNDSITIMLDLKLQLHTKFWSVGLDQTLSCIHLWFICLPTPPNIMWFKSNDAIDDSTSL